MIQQFVKEQLVSNHFVESLEYLIYLLYAILEIHFDLFLQEHDISNHMQYNLNCGYDTDY